MTKQPSDLASASPPQQPRVLVVEHSVKIDGRTYKKLSDAGYLVVRGKPSQFHVLDVALVEHHDALLRAALETVKQKRTYSGGEAVRADFADRLIRLVLARAVAEPIGDAPQSVDPHV